MLLDPFLADAYRRIAESTDSSSAASRARALLQEALAGDNFVLGLCDYLIDSLRTDGGGWRLMPLPVPEQTPYRLRLLVWPPGYANAPHEHFGWTVAGILLNRLEGCVFRRVTNSEHLELSYRFSGAEGDVGVLDPPCIHQLSNPTDRTTVSLHIFSADRPDLTTDSEHRSAWSDHPRSDRYGIGLKQRTELAILEMLRRRGGNSSTHLFDKLFERGSVETKLAICQETARVDPRGAIRRMAILAEFADAAGARRLHALSARLAASLK